jgi:hypothetical protein
MYFAGFLDGHATAGLTTQGTKWAFAEGLEDKLDGVPYETFYLLVNTRHLQGQTSSRMKQVCPPLEMSAERSEAKQTARSSEAEPSNADAPRRFEAELR